MHVAQGWTCDTYGFGLAGVIRLCVWGNRTPEVDAVVEHAVPRDLLVAGAIEAEDGIELIYIHHSVDTKEMKFNSASVFPVDRL